MVFAFEIALGQAQRLELDLVPSKSLVLIMGFRTRASDRVVTVLSANRYLHKRLPPFLLGLPFWITQPVECQISQFGSFSDCAAYQYSSPETFRSDIAPLAPLVVSHSTGHSWPPGISQIGCISLKRNVIIHCSLTRKFITA